MAGPLVRQVQSETRLRYGQSLADLLTARHTAHHQYQNDVRTAQQAAHAQRLAAVHSIPELARIYHQADAVRQDAAHQIELATQGSSSSTSALAMALKGEAALAGSRLASDAAAAKSDAVSRARDAVAGLAYQKRNALESYRANRADLMQQTRDVHAQAGDFAATRLADLQSQQATAERQQANSDRTYNLQVARLLHVNPATGKPLPGAGPKGRTAAQEHQVMKDTAAARDEISLARTWIQRLQQGKNSLPQIVSLLHTGGSLPIPTGQKDSQGQPKFRQMAVPSIKSDFLRAAVELETKGYLSPTSIHNLRTIRNVHLPKEWLPVKVRPHLRRAATKSGQPIFLPGPGGS